MLCLDAQILRHDRGALARGGSSHGHHWRGQWFGGYESEKHPTMRFPALSGIRAERIERSGFEPPRLGSRRRPAPYPSHRQLGERRMKEIA